MGNVHHMPGAMLEPLQVQQPSLNLSRAELIEASGGYVRHAEQLQALHARGFTRAFRRANGEGPVILERAHYDAVVRGQFGQQQAANEPDRHRVTPNRSAFRERFGKRAKA
jgi:hypothetical protein